MVCAMAVRIAASSVTSPENVRQRRPSASMRFRAASLRSVRRANRAMSAPARAKQSAVARPIPEFPPVTNKVFPCMSAPRPKAAAGQECEVHVNNVHYSIGRDKWRGTMTGCPYEADGFARFDHHSDHHRDGAETLWTQMRETPGLPYSELYGGFYVVTRHADLRKIA